MHKYLFIAVLLPLHLLAADGKGNLTALIAPDEIHHWTLCEGVVGRDHSLVEQHPVQIQDAEHIRLVGPGELDPITKQPATNSEFGGYAAALGDYCGVGRRGAAIRRKYMVPRGGRRALLVTMYGVQEDPFHLRSEDPFTSLKITDSTGQDLACGAFHATSASKLPGWVQFDVPNDCPGARGRPNKAFRTTAWRNFLVDLQGLEGSCITIEITSGDCHHSGHWSMTYVQVFTLALDLAVSGRPSCRSGESASITAPPAFSYRWSTGETGRQITTNRGGEFSCRIFMGGEDQCSIVLSTIIPGPPDAPDATFRVDTTEICAGGSVELLKAGPTVLDSTATVLWHDGLGNRSDTAFDRIRYDDPGEYLISHEIYRGRCSAVCERRILVHGVRPTITTEVLCDEHPKKMRFSMGNFSTTSQLIPTWTIGGSQVDHAGDTTSKFELRVHLPPDIAPYEIGVQVIDYWGCTDSARMSVVVPVDPRVDRLLQPIADPIKLGYLIDDLSTNATTVTLTAPEARVVHDESLNRWNLEYPDEGIFRITMIASAGIFTCPDTLKWDQEVKGSLWRLYADPISKPLRVRTTRLNSALGKENRAPRAPNACPLGTHEEGTCSCTIHPHHQR